MSELQLIPIFAQEESSSFLVSPNTGVMIWTVLAFLITLLILKKYAFPLIGEALDKRQKEIEDSMDAAKQAKAEAEQLLAEYRQRLAEARTQAEEILARAKKAGDQLETESLENSRQTKEAMLAQTRKDIDAETRRAIQEIRNEVANMTIMATEKVTRKALSAEDQKRLVDEALAEIDLEVLSEQNRN